MGCIDKYCPHCGSEQVHKMSDDHTEVSGNYQVSYYECGDCDSTWEPHVEYKICGTA